jgi:4'-phosphopantetheinyl transferase
MISDARSISKTVIHTTQNDSAWVTEMFSEQARDVTPFAARHAACLFYAPVSCNPEASSRCASLLSDHERARSQRFVTEKFKTHFEQRRAFRRYCGAIALDSTSDLSQIVFEETENGRPCFSDRSDIWFSFSSCRSGFIGAWSATHGLGVDLADQPLDMEVADLAQMYFTESEARTVGKYGPARLRRFLQLWSLKEAALKSIGEGLPFGLDAFEFELDDGPRVIGAPEDHGGPERFTAHLFDQADAWAALVLRMI